jgi:hypothetical protein
MHRGSSLGPVYRNFCDDNIALAHRMVGAVDHNRPGDSVNRPYLDYEGVETSLEGVPVTPTRRPVATRPAGTQLQIRRLQASEGRV